MFGHWICAVGRRSWRQKVGEDLHDLRRPGFVSDACCSNAAFTDWLTGISGVLVFGATAALALLANRQMGKLTEQAQAAKDQVDVMRDASKAEAEAVQKQIAASIAQGEAIREASRGQLQPIVFAHAHDARIGPDDEFIIGEGEVGFGYRLAN